MLKWLLAGASLRQTVCSPPTEIVTADPLATICAHKVDRPLHIYAVSRSVDIASLHNRSIFLSPNLSLFWEICSDCHEGNKCGQEENFQGSLDVA
jgi:hypothetical protein